MTSDKKNDNTIKNSDTTSRYFFTISLIEYTKGGTRCNASLQLDHS